MSRKKVTIALVSFFIILAAVFMTYFYKVTRTDAKVLPVIGHEGHRVTDFAFTDQDGKTRTITDVKGKIYVVEYFFTTCKGICPKMNENMTKVYDAFKGNESVKILSHTVDPKKDTVGAMKQYSLRFEADPQQWMFLTGDKKELYDMARYSYLVTASDDTAAVDIANDFIHTDRFVLVDREGQIRGQYKGTNVGEVNQLIGDIKELLKD
ncbi:SCO family protein [Polluticoccus soli]|uniref:SCO family protein n=1 Tax=Polluticoccus soli TaxID=3034150 RepID=UPI0023E23025|nr:SCO family protein [Flavipsychrobacter sp. JY13-12]